MLIWYPSLSKDLPYLLVYAFTQDDLIDLCIYLFVLCLIKQELLEDPAIISAIDEETEFNALVVCMVDFTW